MSHPSEDDLILLFYREAAPADEERIREHLESCAQCHGAWQELTRMLELVDAAGVPEPPEGFERVMWARVQQALPEPRTQWSWRHLAPVLAFAAMVLLAVTLGVRWGAAPVETPDRTRAEAPASGGSTETASLRERVLLTALDDHFEQTEVLLTELMNAPEDEALGNGFERTTADDLVASGRLYRVTAEQTGNLRLAQMLDDLEPVLVEVARSPEKVDRKELNSLRSRIDNAGLLFKVRAVTNDIRERQQEIVTANEGGL